MFHPEALLLQTDRLSPEKFFLHPLYDKRLLWILRYKKDMKIRSFRLQENESTWPRHPFQGTDHCLRSLLFSHQLKRKEAHNSGFPLLGQPEPSGTHFRLPAGPLHLHRKSDRCPGIPG